MTCCSTSCIHILARKDEGTDSQRKLGCSPPASFTSARCGSPCAFLSSCPKTERHARGPADYTCHAMTAFRVNGFNTSQKHLSLLGVWPGGGACPAPCPVLLGS